MDMDVDQPRRDDQPRHVNDPLGRFGIQYADRRNDTVVNAHVRDAIEGTSRVDYPPSAKK
jgi:hypothetical protein